VRRLAAAATIFFFAAGITPARAVVSVTTPEEAAIESEKDIAFGMLAEKRYEEAVGVLEKLTAAYPQDREVMYLMVRALRGIKKDIEAAALLELLLKTDPKNTVFLMDASELAIRIGEYDRAISYLGDIAEAEPHNAKAFFGLGNAYVQKADYEMAAEYYFKALLIDPQHYLARFNLGNLYFIAADYEKAIKNFRQTLDIAPRYLPAMTYLAIALYMTGDTPGSDEEFDRVRSVCHEEKNEKCLTEIDQKQQELRSKYLYAH